MLYPQTTQPVLIKRRFHGHNMHRQGTCSCSRPRLALSRLNGLVGGLPCRSDSGRPKESKAEGWCTPPVVAAAAAAAACCCCCSWWGKYCIVTAVGLQFRRHATYTATETGQYDSHHGSPPINGNHKNHRDNCVLFHRNLLERTATHNSPNVHHQNEMGHAGHYTCWDPSAGMCTFPRRPL